MSEVWTYYGLLDICNLITENYLNHPKHKKWAPMLHLHKSLHNTVDLADHLLSYNGQCIVLQRRVLCKKTVHCTEYINLRNVKCVYFAFVVWKSTSSPVISGSVIDTYTGQQWENSEVRRQADLYKGNHQEDWLIEGKKHLTVQVVLGWQLNGSIEP